MPRKSPVESPMASCRPSLLIDLEARQEEVLRKLDDLNRRIEQVVNEGRLQSGAAQLAAPAQTDRC